MVHASTRTTTRGPTSPTTGSRSSTAVRRGPKHGDRHYLHLFLAVPARPQLVEPGGGGRVRRDPALLARPRRRRLPHRRLPGDRQGPRAARRPRPLGEPARGPRRAQALAARGRRRRCSWGRPTSTTSTSWPRTTATATTSSTSASTSRSSRRRSRRAAREIVDAMEAALPGGWPVWTGSNHDAGRLATRWARRRPGPHALRADDAAHPARHAVPLLRRRARAHRRRRDRPARHTPHGRDGGRTPMPWDDGLRGAGEPWLPLHAPTTVAEQRDDPASTLHFVRDLIAAAARRSSREPYEVVDAVRRVGLPPRGPHRRLEPGRRARHPRRWAERSCGHRPRTRQRVRRPLAPWEACCCDELVERLAAHRRVVRLQPRAAPPGAQPRCRTRCAARSGEVLRYEDVIAAAGYVDERDLGLQVIHLDSVVGTVDRGARLRPRVPARRRRAAARAGSGSPPPTAPASRCRRSASAASATCTSSSTATTACPPRARSASTTLDARVTEVRTQVEPSTSEFELRTHERLFAERVPLPAPRSAPASSSTTRSATPRSPRASRRGASA